MWNFNLMNWQLINWRAVTDYEGLYEVSDTGLVRSSPRLGTKGGILNPVTDECGYLRVGLHKNNKRKMYRVHRLVAQAFIENPENKPTIEHWDENKTNNHVSNLCWATKAEQMQTVPCKGYHWHKNRGKWQVSINIPGTGKLKHIGYFEREEDAHAAYIAEKYKHHPFWVKKQEHLEKQKKQKEKEILKIKIKTIKK